MKCTPFLLHTPKYTQADFVVVCNNFASLCGCCVSLCSPFASLYEVASCHAVVILYPFVGLFTSLWLSDFQLKYWFIIYTSSGQSDSSRGLLPSIASPLAPPLSLIQPSIKWFWQKWGTEQNGIKKTERISCLCLFLSHFVQSVLYVNDNVLSFVVFKSGPFLFIKKHWLPQQKHSSTPHCQLALQVHRGHSLPFLIHSFSPWTKGND